MTTEERNEIATILETIAREGLPGPRDLDVALDAIEAIVESSEPVRRIQKKLEGTGYKLIALD